MAKKLKISVGDRYPAMPGASFVAGGAREACPAKEKLRLAASVPGVAGLEIHYPTEVTDAEYKDLKSLADDLGVKIALIFPHLWGDCKWQLGQFSHPDPRLRREAIDLAKRATDIAAYMDARLVIYRPVLDGFDFPFQVDHPRRLNDLLQGLAEWADYADEVAPRTKVAVEHGLFGAWMHNLLPTIGHCLAVINELNRPNLGISIDVTPELIGKENLAESIALISRYGKLFHTRWNKHWAMFNGEMLEALFWLKEFGYKGWFGLPLFSSHGTPEKVVSEAIKTLKFGYKLLNRLPYEDLRMVFQSPGAVEIAQWQRNMLGEKAKRETER